MKKYFLLIPLIGLLFLVSCKTTVPEVVSVSPESTKFVQLDSNVFEKAKYDTQSKTLTLVFKPGAHYEYYNVPQKPMTNSSRLVLKAAIITQKLKRISKERDWNFKL